MQASQQETQQGRFVEIPGGVIYDMVLEQKVASVNVGGLTTFDAAEVMSVLCRALNKHYGSEMGYREYDKSGRQVGVTSP